MNNITYKQYKKALNLVHEYERQENIKIGGYQPLKNDKPPSHPPKRK